MRHLPVSVGAISIEACVIIMFPRASSTCTSDCLSSLSSLSAFTASSRSLRFTTSSKPCLASSVQSPGVSQLPHQQILHQVSAYIFPWAIPFVCIALPAIISTGLGSFLACFGTEKKTSFSVSLAVRYGYPCT